MTIFTHHKSYNATDLKFTEGKMIVFIQDGREVSIPLAWFPKLRNASPAELDDWRFIGDGEGIHWDSLDEDLLVSELIT